MVGHRSLLHFSCHSFYLPLETAATIRSVKHLAPQASASVFSALATCASSLPKRNVT
jgi:hypothetical protein